MLDAYPKDPAEVDRYKIRATPGDRLLIEVQARELGSSKIEAILTAFDSAGKKIDSAGDKPLLKGQRSRVERVYGITLWIKPE